MSHLTLSPGPGLREIIKLEALLFNSAREEHVNEVGRGERGEKGFGVTADLTLPISWCPS